MDHRPLAAARARLTGHAGDAQVELPAPPAYDLARTMGVIQLGPYDPCVRRVDGALWWARRTPQGVATLRIATRQGDVVVDAWGPGCDWVRRHAGRLCGLEDAPRSFDPEHPLLARMARQYPGIHMPQALGLFERLVPTILQQLVTWREAARGYSLLVEAHGEPAPGPNPGPISGQRHPERGLMVPPSAQTLSRLPVYAYVPLGVLGKQARTIRAAAASAHQIEALLERAPAEAYVGLQRIRGIGPWTAAFALATAMGWSDAVPENDLHLPREVAWALTRVRDADDAKMLALLEPFRPHRWRAIQLIRLAKLGPPRRRPRRGMRPLPRR